MLLMRKLYTKDYRHDYFFNFKGKSYPVHSIVKLTEEGRNYLKSLRKEVILTEQFYNWNNVICWKYEFKSIKTNEGITNYSTDKSPDELIEEVIMPATVGYMEREVLGASAPSYILGTKYMKKDWEIPEIKKAFAILVAVFIGAYIFKDWYVQLIIRVVAGFIFGIYRQNYINAYITYTHDEDTEMLKKKFEVLYGIKSHKEN